MDFLSLLPVIVWVEEFEGHERILTMMGLEPTVGQRPFVQPLKLGGSIQTKDSIQISGQ